MSAPTEQYVRTQIEALREKLLDLTLRNRMLNYKPSKRLSVVIEGEDSTALYTLLVEDGKRFSFVGKPDPPKANARLDPDLSGADDEVSMAKHREDAIAELEGYLGQPAFAADKTDTKLNTPEFESTLQPKLRTILREANLANEELGINTLFLTLGTLEWCETPDRTFRAPLVFIPVKLTTLANGSVRLMHEGGDPGTNLPLSAKLLEHNLRLPEWNDEKSLASYFSEVVATVRDRRDWEVHPDEIHLGFFSYEKYAMYVDLGGENWPEGRKPWLNPDLAAMFGGGYASADSEVHGDCFLDDVRPVAECHEVYDADSSQTIAMVRASEGYSMVVEGPPGTGKSQTITNIIAEAVAAGKSVLFVSAKRAALEVVTRRLDEAGLKDVYLDLHDKGANRKAFYAEINRTMSQGLKIKEEQERVQRLTELRDLLTRYSRAVNEPLPEFNTTPFVAMGRLARLPKETNEDRDGRIDFHLLKAKTVADVDRAVPRLAALEARLKTVGIPVEHPFWRAEITYLDPALRLDLEQDLTAAIAALETARSDWTTAANLLCVDVEPTLDRIQVLKRCAERAEAAPELNGVELKAATWHAEASAVREAIAALQTHLRIRAALTAQVRPEIWDADLGAIVVAYQDWSPRWYRFVSGTYRGARNTLRGWLSEGAPTDPQGQLALVEQVRQAQTADARLRELDDTMQRLFGAQWAGVESDPAVLQVLLDWVLSLRQDVEQGTIPGGLLDFFAGKTPMPEVMAAVTRAEESTILAAGQARDIFKALSYPTEALSTTPLGELGAMLASWRQHLPRLSDYIAFRESRRQAAEVVPAEVIELADTWPHAASRLAETYQRSYFAGVVKQAMHERPDLRTFERHAHEQAIAEFQTLDDFKLRYNRARVRLEHHRRLPSFRSATGNLATLKLQCGLTRKHKPIRWAMVRAGEAVMRIKPVFLMSPLSVAIHLPPELPEFDMVIFDEASQVRPEDALCAIARAKQCIVVGDTKQMPPTSFFDRVLVDEGDEEIDEEHEYGAEARKLESILSLLGAVATDPKRRPMLRWHYRSIHPSLIQPSNELFYDNQLVIFPSPSVEVEGRRIGVVFRHGVDTIYEGGSRKRVNVKEAESVAQAVLAHIANHPEESLLVAAMNKPQADLIYDEVAKLERLHAAEFNTFRARHPHEPLSVKNLETVQGDERDVVFVSITYGRDASGVIRQQFGPILQDGGERRLNVLFTRARRRCEVFSNLRSDDIRADAGRVGVVALKAFLQFAESGSLYVPQEEGDGPESPFEVEVADALQRAGYEVHSQVGCEGYRIDLCVVDPNLPGRYVLGIECDGATYHSARSARDRDKLRQRVLENRGWRLYRIWSPDWWQDRDAEISRLLKAVDDAISAMPTDPRLPEAEIDESFVEESEQRMDSMPLRRAYHATPLRELEENAAQLKAYATEIIRTEGPVHHELLLMRMREAVGIARLGAQVRTWLEVILEQLTDVHRITDAWFFNSAQLMLPRDWSDRPADEKKTTFVTEAEIAAALKSVVRRSFGIPEREAAKEAWTLLGFKRVTEVATSRADQVLAKLLAEGGVARRDGLLYPP